MCQEVLHDDYISIYFIPLQLIKTGVEQSIFGTFERKTFPLPHTELYKLYKLRITIYKPNQREFADSFYYIYTQWCLFGIANGKKM